jgi:Mn2+/Fe2+ NRAMP family transporter
VTFRRFLERKPPTIDRPTHLDDGAKVLRWPRWEAAVPPPLRGRLAKWVPGVVTGVADVDPALVLTATVAGAIYGHSLLWVVPLCIPFLITIFAVSARIGNQTEQGLVDLLRQHYGRGVALTCASLVIVINLAMIIADLRAVSEAFSMIVQQSQTFFVVAIAFTVWYILIFRDYYRITHALAWLSLPLFAYMAAGVLSVSDPGQVLKNTFWPTHTQSSNYIIAFIAMVGSLLTPYVLVWQSSSRRERALVGDREPYGPGHHAGGLVAVFVSYFVLLTAAEVLHGQVSGTLDFRQAANALAPLGEAGPLLFSLGIIGAGMVALPVLIASMCYSFAEAMGWRSGLSEHPWEASRFYVMISVVVFVAAAANFFPISAVGVLYYSQVLAGILTVPILVFILLLSNDRRIMRTTNTAMQNFWIGAAAGGLICAAVLSLFR